MKLSGSLAKAQAIAPGQHAKARDLHYDLENELEHGLYDEDEADEGERAIAHLEAHHPGVREASRSLTRPPALSRSAKRSVDEGSDAEDEPEPEREPSSSPRTALVSGGSRSGYRTSAGRRHTGPSARRAFDRASGGAAEDLSGYVIRGLQFLLAAGVAYQLLQPKGAGAFSSVLGGLTSGVRRFVEPVDPFGSSGATSAFGQAQAITAAAAAANPNVFDTPTGVQPYSPPTFGAPQGTFDTPGGVAPYIPPTGIPGLRLVTGPAASHVKQPSSPLSLNIRVPALL